VEVFVFNYLDSEKTFIKDGTILPQKMVIGKKECWLVLLLFLVPLVRAEEKDCVYYFYGKDCRECKEVDSYLTKLQAKYPSLNLQKFEVYYHKENYLSLEKFLKSYNVPEEAQGVPAVFIGKSYFTTPQAIIDFLEERIKDNAGAACPAIENVASVGVVGANEPYNVLETLTFSRTTGNAIIHTSNAAMIAVVLLLLSFLVAVRNKQEVAKRGFIFISGIFIAYVLFSVGFFSWFQTSSATSLFYKTMGLLAMIIGAVRIRGFFNSWEELFGILNEKWQRFLLIFRLYLISPLSFLFLGFLGGLLTLGKTSNVFITLRGVLLGNFQAAAVPLLFYYLFILLLPQILIVLILFRIVMKIEGHAHKKSEEGFSWKDAEKKRQAWWKHHWKLLNFVVGWVLFVMGMLVLFL